MEQDRWEALLEQALNNTLNPEQEQEFVQALRQDPAREAQFLHLLEQDELLSATLNPARSGESFEEQVRLRVHGRDGAPFVKAVLDRARSASPRTRRRLLRSLRTNRSAGPWQIALIAAGLLIGILALVTALSDKPVPRKTPLAVEPPTQTVPDTPDRREMEERLQEIERKREQLSKPPAQPESDPAVEENRRKALQDLARERERIEREMKRSVEQAKPPERPIPVEQAKQPPAPEGKPEAKTEAAIARVEEAEGEILLSTKEGKSPAKAGTDLTPGQGLETGGGASRLVLRFSDQTRVELGPETTLTEVRAESGKRIMVAKGTLRAEVSKQPKDQPAVFASPHGEAKVLGTTLRLVVDPDPKKGMRLDVEEGKVQLKNLAGKAVDVVTGHFAVAAVGIELTAKPAAAELPTSALLAGLGELTISFGLPGRKLPQGTLIDSGEPFDARRGYGWQGTNDLMRIPGADAVLRRRAHSAEGSSEQDLRGSRINAGGADNTELWLIKLPKGRYLVTVCVGAYGPAGRGPQHVQVEGVQVIDAVKCKPGEFVEKSDVAIEVKDGLMRMMIGGHRRKDGTTAPWYNLDTALNFIRIKKAP